jgi:hypothetical protein
MIKSQSDVLLSFLDLHDHTIPLPTIGGTRRFLPCPSPNDLPLPRRGQQALRNSRASLPPTSIFRVGGRQGNTVFGEQLVIIVILWSDPSDEIVIFR